MSTTESVLRMIRAGEYDSALQTLERLEAAPETRCFALGTRAWLHRHRGRYEEALKDYQAFVEYMPGDPEARALLAEMRLLLDDAPGALKEAVSVLSSDPNSVRAADVIVRCQERLGHREVPSVPPPWDRPTVPLGPVNPVIEVLEKDPSSFPTSIYPEIGRMLYAFVRALHPGLVVETGSHVGYSALCIAQALEDNGGGHLHCFDLFAECPAGYVSPVMGSCASLLEVARGHLEKAGLAHRVSLHPGDSSSSIREEFAGAAAEVDLAFIDGDHTIDGCTKDWRAVDGILKPGGIVFFHDTIPKDCGWLGPRHLLEGLRNEQGTDYPWINIQAVDRLGFAVLQKRTASVSIHWRPSLWELLVDKLLNEKFRRERGHGDS